MKTRGIKEYPEILLIEDNPEQAAKMITTIEKHQNTDKVLWLEDGVQAMDYLLGNGIFTGRNVNNNPKMIFLDTKVPRKNGLEILCEIRTTPGLNHIPVVFMCSTQRELDQVESYHLNVKFGLKPLSSLEFDNVIGSFKQSNNEKALPITR